MEILRGHTIGTPPARFPSSLLKNAQLFLCHLRANRLPEPQIDAGCSKRSPARPQRAMRRSVPLRYVEPLSEARTKLEAFFNILPGGKA